jgi:hypothetical protein
MLRASQSSRPFGRRTLLKGAGIAFAGVATQASASIPGRELKRTVVSLAEHRDQITRALDILLVGFWTKLSGTLFVTITGLKPPDVIVRSLRTTLGTTSMGRINAIGANITTDIHGLMKIVDHVAVFSSKRSRITFVAVHALVEVWGIKEPPHRIDHALLHAIHESDLPLLAQKNHWTYLGHTSKLRGDLLLKRVRRLRVRSKRGTEDLGPSTSLAAWRRRECAGHLRSLTAFSGNRSGTAASPSSRFTTRTHSRIVSTNVRR